MIRDSSTTHGDSENDSSNSFTSLSPYLSTSPLKRSPFEDPFFNEQNELSEFLKVVIIGDDVLIEYAS